MDVSDDYSNPSSDAMSNSESGVSGVIEEMDEDICEISPPREDAIKVLYGHQKSIFCIDFDKTGTLLASGGQDDVAIIWNVDTCQSIFIAEGHEDSVISVKFSPNGAYLCTGDMAGTIFIWIRPTSDDDQTRWDLLVGLNVGDLLWTFWLDMPDRQPSNSMVLFAGDENGSVTYWPIQSNESDIVDKVKCLPSSGYAALDANIVVSAADKNALYMVVLYRNADVKLWDLRTRTLLECANLLSSQKNVSSECSDSAVFHLVSSKFNNKNHLIISGCGFLYPVVILENQNFTKTLKCLEPIKVGEDTVEALEFSSTHPYFAFGTVTGVLGIGDASSFDVRCKWTYYSTVNETESEAVGITSLCWSKSSPIFFTGTTNGSVVAWSALNNLSDTTKSPCPLNIWWGHRAPILDITLPSIPLASSVGKSSSMELLEPFVATSSDDATVRCFPLKA